MSNHHTASANTTKIDIWHNGKSVSVRLPLHIKNAFDEKCTMQGLTKGEGASQAQREHNGSLAEAITKWVGQVVLHRTREAWCGALVELMRPVFAKRGYPLPDRIRAAIAFTSKGWRGKVRGECWSADMSADGATEIMVCLREKDAVEILNILTHELVHAAQYAKSKADGKPVSKGGHGKDFRVIAEAMDMTGDPKRPGTEKMKCLRGDPAGAWGDWALAMLEQVGPMPHHALAEHVAKQKKQTTRMLKLECPDEECGAVWRMAGAKIAPLVLVCCPCCARHFDNPHYDGEEVDEEGLDNLLTKYGPGDEIPGSGRKAGKPVTRRTKKAASDDSPTCRKCGKADGRPMLGDRYGKHIHHNCYAREQNEDGEQG